MYQGGCHCGAVRYKVEVALDGVLACNCTICSKKGSLLAFAGADQFELLSGEGNLSDYQFNQKNIHHLFCKTCGIQSFSRGTGPDGKQMVAINARCLDGVDIDALSINHFDGRAL